MKSVEVGKMIESIMDRICVSFDMCEEGCPFYHEGEYCGKPMLVEIVDKMVNYYE